MLLAACLLSGCSDSGRVPTFPAGGIVRFADGQPLSGGSIICESPQGLSARGKIDATGKFQLGTYELDDGAVEGKHLVAISPKLSAERERDAAKRTAPAMLDDRYANAQTSGIEIDVKADGENQFQIELVRPGR
jgi:hypothetical protein